MDAPNNTLSAYCSRLPDNDVFFCRHSRRSCFVISAEGGMTNKWSEAGIQLKYASGVAGHHRGEAAK